MSMAVDYSIGSWVVKQDNEHAILIVKDIDGMVEDLVEGLKETRLKSLKQRLMSIIDNMEYGVVTVQRNGTVKWQGGQFVMGESDITRDDLVQAANVLRQSKQIKQ